ncbi:MAG: GMC family oxidoreductase [Roseiarcus sp.]|uniref:GMC family oxidoreductase n=1 Tax=Roseiarcus sp. TaxID=1969460 RepID=UPI003C37859E
MAGGSRTFDYVVVGSGAGGGTVAARLAEAGVSVLVLEAGADPAALKAEGLPQDYDVPAFHPFASENKAMAWNFMVHDFGDDAERRRRPEDDPPPGLLYPRASTLGGCTAHNAMILMAPQDSDWNAIADLTRDPTWRAEAMRRYFQRIEDCRYRPLWRLLSQLTCGRLDPTGHGWRGWLPAERPLPPKAFSDHPLMCAIRDAVRADLLGGSKSAYVRASKWAGQVFERWARVVVGEADPNDRRLQGRLEEGLTAVPLSTSGGRRRGTRERLLAAMSENGLSVEYDALVTRVLLDGDNRAVGVEYLKGRNLYRASPNPSDADGEQRQVFARREVILAAGAFNTPQILMLSGIGPAGDLGALGIDVRVDLSGVGRNLQDRYEIGVIHKTRRPWACLAGAEFKVGDAVYDAWLRARGMYVSNGAAVAFSLRSSVAGADPDLFVMALLTRFSGYFPGYSSVIRESRGDLTFAVLKAHTNNRGGRVTLATSDPRDPPRVDFHYFEEGTDVSGDDLTAVVDGVRRVRAMTAAMRREVLMREDTPGPELTDEGALKQYVREHAWGHHASCTCPIGPREAGGALASDFRVHGTKGLRVVDASVFPRIPGYFIVCAIYMIAEKAADVILAAASAEGGETSASGMSTTKNWRKG